MLQKMGAFLWPEWMFSGMDACCIAAATMLAISIHFVHFTCITSKCPILIQQEDCGVICHFVFLLFGDAGDKRYSGKYGACLWEI